MIRTTLGAAALLFAVGCGNAPPPAPPSRGAPTRGAAGSAPAGAAPAPAAGDGDAGFVDDAPRPPPLAISDSDLTESDRARDPFRSFIREFIPVGPQVQVVENNIRLRDYGLDELKLVAVILGTGNPYAMLVDPTGRGTIIRRGDYVGRPDTVSASEGGMMPHQVPWRLSRIVGTRVRRDGDNNLAEEPAEVVFEREDRLNPTARAEHVLSLTPGGQATAPPGGNSAPSVMPSLPSFGGAGSPFLPAAPSGRGESSSGSSGISPGGSYVQSYTTVTPPSPAQPASPTTVVIQTGPHGETSVQGQQPAGEPAPSAPVGPPNPYGPPRGGTNVPPPVRITGSTPLPTSGLPE